MPAGGGLFVICCAVSQIMCSLGHLGGSVEDGPDVHQLTGMGGRGTDEFRCHWEFPEKPPLGTYRSNVCDCVTKLHLSDISSTFS